MIPQERVAELFQCPVLDLAHALLGDAKALAERFEGRALVLEPAFADDAKLAVVEHVERRLEPRQPPFAVDGFADRFVGEGHVVDQEVLAVGRTRFGFVDRRVQRHVRTGEPRVP